MVLETHLWLIRHAPVSGPPGVLHDLQTPADISDSAALLRLRAQLPANRHAITSYARRTQQTARALGLEPRVEAAFNEQDFGQWTGRTHDELRRAFGAAYDDFWREPASSRPPGGETFVEQIARVRGAIDALPADDVVVVAHGGTIRAALAVALDIAAETALRFVIDPWSLTRLDRLDGGWRIVAVNRV
ncbi:MAG TPA: histidine phosphatase family protein [Bradyrhizobium sp.]|nr:histidine phosphatase family protein [Bradyrhizobium sp.]